MNQLRSDVVSQILSILQSLDEGGSPPFDERTPLIGDKGVVDSQRLLQLLLALEDFSEERFGIQFDWMTDNAFSARRSPFSTVATLAEFFLNQVQAAEA